jgi:hypothetical protein
MKEFEINFISFEFWFWFKPSLNRAAQCCATQARVTAPRCRPVSLPFALSCTPLLTPGPASPLSRSSAMFACVTTLPTAAALPCSCTNGATRARWPGSPMGRSALPTALIGPPFAPSFSLHVDAPTGPPFSSSLCPTPLSRIQNKCQPPPHAPFSAPLSSHPGLRMVCNTPYYGNPNQSH